ncbi:MAG: methylated-DNA--[protein]-cysteine S-methyltransferase [Coriobacteriales bacterium]|nr:methylated-DNA--[protein]-cysteine S-methyltransferase [Coriobacteriales bacterium]
MVRRTEQPLLIRYSIGDSRLGPVLVGQTGKGVCCVLFLDGKDAEDLLHAEFSSADTLRDDAAVSGALAQIVAVIDGEADSADVPLDLVGTEFQVRVWEELRRIPRGETATYAEVAARAGRPNAVRAVGNACGRNPASIVVPCHRVVRSDGGLGGFGWGLDRKRALLEAEKRD